MSTNPRWLPALAAVLLLLPAVARADDRNDDEQKADTCIARGMEKIKASAEAPPDRKRRLFQEACDLFARAVGYDDDCDQRLFAAMPDPETPTQRFLRAELHAMFARAFTAHQLWERALNNVDAAINLQTVRQNLYRQLKAEIIRRKREAEGA